MSGCCSDWGYGGYDDDSGVPHGYEVTQSTNIMANVGQNHNFDNILRTCPKQKMIKNKHKKINLFDY